MAERTCETKSGPNINGLIDVIGALLPAVVSHCSVLCQNVSEMETCCDVGQVAAVELQRRVIGTEIHVSALLNNLGLGLGGSLVDTEADVVFRGELLTHLEHGGHVAPGRGHQQEVYRV